MGAAGGTREIGILDEERAIGLIRTTINAACERDNVLFIGRGSQVV
ncbi:MAG: hypothetical protein H5T69_10395 [Chloroflexi bacterium]|nr:hypothetical protein [Chloroflexota bacterium]